jgi:gliding motility-associated-like protein
VDSGYFADGYYPGWLMNDIMEMDSVSVDDQGNVLISWFPYPANDIEWYYLYRSDQFQGGFYKIDSVPSDIHFYLDTQSSANLESVSYRVAAKDTCHAPGPGGFTNPFSTIFLRPLLWDYCDTAIELNWDSVKWMNPPPDLYQIYKVDPENHSLNTFIGETTQTNYTYETGFKPDSTYCFFVRAKDPAGKSSSSCIQCFTANRPEQPDTLNFRLASVDTAFNDRIEISVFTDTVPSATTCLILKYSGNYNDIDTLALIPVLSNDWISWSDTTADPNTSSYVYETVILDGCNNPAWLPENRVKTIFLQGTAAQNINYLSWNNYSGSTSEAAYYMLYRKINGLIDAVFTTATDTSYMDNLNDVNQKSGRFSYLVEAKTVNSLIPTAELDTLSSFSNEIQIVQISRINMPNAFTPNSDDINDFFGPMNVFTDEDAEFSFLIFNRWGQKIFESSDIRTRGWDGTVGGSPAPTGVYLYLVRYVTPEGLIYEAKGPFTLLR